MAYTPQSPNLLASFLAVSADVLLPILSEDELCDLSALLETAGITLPEDVHHLVRGPECSVSQRAITGQIVDELMQGVEIPHHPPGIHAGHNEVGRIDGVVFVLVWRVFTVLPEHPIARHFNVEVSDASFADLVGDDKLDSSILAESAGEA